MKAKKKKKTVLKNLSKRISTLALTALLVFSSVFTCYSVEVSATEGWGTFEEELEELLISIGTRTNLIDAVRSGSYAAGAVLGAYAGSALGVPPEVSGAMGSWAFGSVTNGVLDWYENNTVETERIRSGDDRSFQAIKRTGAPTAQNTTNYNTTKNMSIYNDSKTWNTTTNTYDYSYNWYNPITNNYDITNEYYYNTEYNTYNYVTHNYDITNNYNYTTNYYIQDNRTYVSYYIINVCDETGEEEETYVEMYYELPDGRNSLNLTVDDIKGQYFPSNYSKYVSVAEDDGTTLGLWHLDGDLKDSSYWGNTAGSSYNNVYTDGLYSNGKQFSDSEEDFLELKLDKVDLPETWTLEWCEYIPSNSVTKSQIRDPSLNSKDATRMERLDISSTKAEVHYYFDDVKHASNYYVYFNNYLAINDSSDLYEPVAGYFIPYAITFDGNEYKLYRNGVLANEYDFKSSLDSIYSDDFSDSISFLSGLEVNSNVIKFYTKPDTVSALESSQYNVANFFYDDSWNNDGSLKFRTLYYYENRINCNLVFSSHKNSIIDEVRLSSGILYSGESYIPSSQAYTTNTVLAVPENPKKHEIAFKTNTDISDVRFGGVKPTYPTNGYVYVALDADNKVESVQQYQENGWCEIESSFYSGTDWVSFSGFNMDYLAIDGDTGDTGGDSGDTGGDSGDTGDDSGGNNSGSGIQSIIDGIGKFFDTLLNLVGKVIGLISDFVNSVLTLFESFTVFTDGFSGFLTGAFGFIPQEAINVIVAGITLIVILAIIKFLK